MNDPYRVLGVSESASDDEIKKAYRELSRKYHPDSYVDNPLKDLAEDKFKEVQLAYDEIVKRRQNSGYSYSGNRYQSRNNNSYGNSTYNNNTYNNSSYNSNGYNNNNSYTNSGNNDRYQQVCNYINFRQYRNALNELAAIGTRDGRWYYLSAIANAGMGNNFQANNDINTACSMEPGNMEYVNFKNQLQMSSQRYQSNYNRYYPASNRNNECGSGNLCCDLWMADTCCECMGGDLCNCM